MLKGFVSRINKQLPLVLVNFKNFKETTGENGFNMANSMLEELKELRLQITISVQPFLMSKLNKNKERVFGQHIDAIGYGSSTGGILPEALKEEGVVGSILNHSEKRMTSEEIEFLIPKMKKLKLVSVLCVESVQEIEQYRNLKPDFFAIEPRELIGGDISVSTANPELIEEAVEKSEGVPVLVGAGIKNSNDLKIALDLGAVGILVASGVCKADDPIAVLKEFENALD